MDASSETVERDVEAEQRVGPLELFFDLVCAALIAYEALRFREARARVRAARA